MAWILPKGLLFIGSVCFVLPAHAAPGQTHEGPTALTLSQALVLALEASPAWAVAQAQHQVAEAQVGAVKSAYFPQVALSADYTRHRNPNIIVPIHQAGVFPPLDDDHYQTQVQARLPLFTAGRQAAAYRAAQAGAAASAAQAVGARVQLIEGVAQLFVQVQAQEDTQQLLRTRLEALRQRYDELVHLLAEGRCSPAEVALVQAAIASARADSIDVASQRYELAVLLGQQVGAEGPVFPVVSGLSWPSIPPDSTLVDTAPRGPQVDKAQAQLVQSKARQTQAARSGWPEVSAFGAYSLQAGDDFEAQGEWAVGVQLQLPLFDGGRQRAERQSTQASVRVAQASMQAAQQAERAQRRIALDRWQATRARWQQLVEASTAKAQSVAAQQTLYRAGRLNLGALLTQETELLALRLQERNAVYGQVLAVLGYYATTGTLTIDRIEAFLRSTP